MRLLGGLLSKLIAHQMGIVAIAMVSGMVLGGVASASYASTVAVQDALSEEDDIVVEYDAELSAATVSSFADELYPGSSTQSSVAINNSADEGYVVEAHLVGYSDTDGESGLEAAGTPEDGHISQFTLGGVNYTFDLLNDGVATFHEIPANTTQLKNTTVTVPEDSKADGNVSVEVGLRRVSDRAPAGPVRNHENRTDDCAECHTGADATAVHDAEAVGDDCQTCHGRSRQDLHADCDEACHDDYPIDGHGPDAERPVEAEYRCGEDCHGKSTAMAHRTERDGHCGSCHSDDGDEPQLLALHSGTDQTCVDCHGQTTSDVHADFEPGECTTCHVDITAEAVSGTD